MIEIKPTSVTAELLKSLGGMPLIICSDSPRLQKKMDAAGYKIICINKILSKKLLSYSPDERHVYVESELRKIMTGPHPILLTEFEMLFDPRYEIDLLKIICERARFMDIAVRWSGGNISTKLTYAAPGDPDYHEYDCEKYQIRIVR